MPVVRSDLFPHNGLSTRPQSLGHRYKQKLKVHPVVIDVTPSFVLFDSYSIHPTCKCRAARSDIGEQCIESKSVISGMPKQPLAGARSMVVDWPEGYGRWLFAGPA